jgi:hypothetical protein
MVATSGRRWDLEERHGMSERAPGRQLLLLLVQSRELGRGRRHEQRERRVRDGTAPPSVLGPPLGPPATAPPSVPRRGLVVHDDASRRSSAK